MRRVRKRRVWLQNWLLCFGSRVGGASCIRGRGTLSPHFSLIDGCWYGQANKLLLYLLLMKWNRKGALDWSYFTATWPAEHAWWWQLGNATEFQLFSESVSSLGGWVEMAGIVACDDDGGAVVVVSGQHFSYRSNLHFQGLEVREVCTAGQGKKYTHLSTCSPGLSHHFILAAASFAASSSPALLPSYYLLRTRVSIKG